MPPVTEPGPIFSEVIFPPDQVVPLDFNTCVLVPVGKPLGALSKTYSIIHLGELTIAESTSTLTKVKQTLFTPSFVNLIVFVLLTEPNAVPLVKISDAAEVITTDVFAECVKYIVFLSPALNP